MKNSNVLPRDPISIHLLCMGGTLGRKGDACASDKGEDESTDIERRRNQNNIEKLARYIGKKKNPRHISNVLCALSAEILV